MPSAMICSRTPSCPTIVASGKSQLPNVWSPWWWVLTSVVIGRSLTLPIASRKALVRRSVEQASMTTTPRRPARNPVLLIHQLPSGWT